MRQNLYNSDDCSGIPIPKATTYLKVQVFVDHAKEMKKHTKEFKEIFWDKLLEFWGGILAVFFALLLFLLRRHLKKWFGFEDKK
ncbi:hypothetical protein [Desulfobacterium sp. N47]|uniref:Uncharacterized protein n=1 Tax=uncultured Desulfobacterium sp. TaxID=201089 RepID=E1YDN4_9BACT|nr:unknown protein [uncultured Desulfobacterium sp.]